jgi:hypothetical protein
MRSDYKLYTRGIKVKDITKRTIILGIIFILMMISIVPIQASENKKDTFPQKNLAASENILANITVTWDSFFHRFSLNDLQPKVIINQSAIKDFYFPEINDTIEQINFTVVFKHRLEKSVLIPRFTRVYLAISYNDTYIFLHESINYRCKNLVWEYQNFTVTSANQLVPLITNGENVTLTVEVGAFGFPFGSQGITEILDPITLHPIQTRS